ncbi:MAG TPA: hypothetical protein VE956_17210 [Nodularia sp. (in: cyanobacteria)]|nr:hypothetical protein [Nodularia sp. (in: cyanobacteria)]
MLTHKTYRYLAAYSGAMRSFGQTYRIAYRLHKNDRLCRFLNQVKVQLEDLLGDHPITQLHLSGIQEEQHRQA